MGRIAPRCSPSPPTQHCRSRASSEPVALEVGLWVARRRSGSVRHDAHPCTDSPAALPAVGLSDKEHRTRNHHLGDERDHRCPETRGLIPGVAAAALRADPKPAHPSPSSKDRALARDAARKRRCLEGGFSR